MVPIAALGGSLAGHYVVSHWNEMVSATDKNASAFSRRLHKNGDAVQFELCPVLLGSQLNMLNPSKGMGDASELPTLGIVGTRVLWPTAKSRFVTSRQFAWASLARRLARQEVTPIFHTTWEHVREQLDSQRAEV